MPQVPETYGGSVFESSLNQHLRHRVKNIIKITYRKNGVLHTSTFRGITKAEAVAHVEKGPVAVWIEGIEE